MVHVTGGMEKNTQRGALFSAHQILFGRSNQEWDGLGM